VDGQIDLGADQIEVPEGGLQMAGLGFDVSGLTNSGGPMFINASGASYAGNLQIGTISITSPSVFDLDNDENSGAVECNDVNFVGCASLGELNAYRQGLWSGVGIIFCDDGLTMSGVWSGGFASLTSIVIGGFSGTVFKAGAGLTIGGSFRSDVNALGLASNGVFCDFAEANILSDEGLLIEGFRTAADDAFPNISSGSVKARFRSCKGVDNTYIGGQWRCTSSTTTTIVAANTPAKLAGGTTYADMQWFSNTTDNAFVYDGSGNVRVQVNVTVPLSGDTGDEVNTIIRQWDDSASAYIDLGESGPVTLSLFGAFASISVHGFASMDTDDRIEIWVENKSDGSDVTMQTGGIVSVSER